MTPSGAAGDPLEAAVFDLDGVITRTASLHEAAWKETFDAFLARGPAGAGEERRPFTAEDYRAYVDGRPRYEGVRAFLASRAITLPEGGLDDPPDAATVRSLGRRKNDLFRALLAVHGAPVDEGAVRLVRGLKQAGVRVGVATSSANGRLVLDRSGIADLFDAWVDGALGVELGLRGKPRPDYFLECARRLRVRSPARALVLEDAQSGVVAARAGGFGLVIGVDRGGHWLGLREAGADWIVERMDELSVEGIGSYWAARSVARPNLLHAWGVVARALRGRRLAVFLDYDGTLTPIVDRPERAVLDPAMRATLERLARALPTQVVSGRGLEDVRRRVGIADIGYAGSHGYEIAAPGARAGVWQAAPEVEPEMHRAAEELRGATGPVAGVFVEDKRFSIAVHYRLVDGVHVPALEGLVEGVVARHPALRMDRGKMVFQVLPARAWDKGRALLWMLEATGLADAFPIYLGDDTTDEDAFAVVLERGLGVLVTELPRPTAARYALQDPREVRIFLERLLRAAGEVER